VLGNFVYLADQGQGYQGYLRIIDASLPGAPVEVGSFETPAGSYGIAVSGSYAYIADWAAGVRVIDVSNPSAPREVGFYDTPGTTGDIALAGDYAYIADREGGLFILVYNTPIETYLPLVQRIP